ncbi:Transcriptional regulator HilA [Roseovarius albus]|uniref:Transcriptional regulator HilA n=1 Tax=Roseovarius albus TaxID=1247867 RepID=A0A1X6YXB6_9RHOB|nr:tetratricopeptide repeat protein [Roseovarius albus]SLN34483.1 Transcriptional regulator HilA [Roseovarius albus]
MKGRFGNCEIDTGTRVLLRNGEEIELEPQVFDVIVALIEGKDKIVSKDDLIEQVWSGRIVSDTAITSRVKAARSAVGDDGVAQSIIRTSRGIGYRFVADFETLNDAHVAEKMRGPAHPTILVLPFVQNSPDSSMNWLVDGISDDVITGLSRFRELRVISRLTSFGLRDLHGSALSDAATELSADYVIQGSLRMQGHEWKLRVSIVDAAEQMQIWSERWTLAQRSLQNLDPILDKIVAAIEPELLSAERDRVRNKQETDLSTWESTQKGLWLLWQQKSGLHEQAIKVLEEACQSDPGYAQAHAGLAYALCHAYKEDVLGDEALDWALDVARQSVHLDPRDAFSYIALGRSHIARGEYEEAIAAYDEAVELNPNHAYGHFGRGYALSLSGRAHAAIEHFETVLELSPRDPQGWSVCVMLCFSNLIMNRPEIALSWAQKSQRMPNAPHWAKAAEAAALNALGNTERATRALEEAITARPELNAAFLDKAYPFADRRDFYKIAELMLGTFVPDEHEESSKA